LTVPREEFETEIDDRIKRGGELLERTDAIQSQTDLVAVRSDFYTWNDYNRELLTRRFTTSEVIEEYSCVGPFMAGGLSSLGERVRDLQGDIQQSIRRLESIKERITLIPEAAMFATTTNRHHASAQTKRSRSSSSTATMKRLSSPSTGSFAM